MRFAFETVDVFAMHRFGGNPLAVFPSAKGLSDAEMQALAMELNLSETTFVLPSERADCLARVRIFNRTHEMPFAGHPMIGTAFVLSRLGLISGDEVRLDIPAGPTDIAIQFDGHARPYGARVTAPQPLSEGQKIPPATIADCLGLAPSDILTGTHQPVIASVGNTYVIAELRKGALRRCIPNLAAFRQAVLERPALNGRFSIHVYSRSGDQIRARMFAPLAGTWEDPATGSANAPLAALLLSRSNNETADFTVRQGFEMGRPSYLKVSAWRESNRIRASVAGKCVPIFSGEVAL